MISWKWLVFALLGGVALFHIGAVIYIGDRDYQLTSDDYYGLELAYDADMARMRAGAAYSWATRLADDDGRLCVTVHDAAGRAVALDNAQAAFYKPNDAGQDHAVALRPDAPGSYSSPGDRLNRGPWKLTVTGTVDGRAVAWQTRLVL